MLKHSFFFSTMIIMLFLVFAFTISDSFAYLMEKTNLEQYQENEIILIGNVVNLTETPSEGFTEYEIKVEKFIKNPQTLNTLFVIGNGAKSSDIHLSIEQIYNVDDRVFLFLNEKDDEYRVSPYSFNALNFDPDEGFLLPPLTLYRAGIPAEDIVCRNNLELVIKANDESPACVTLKTKKKLIERGWMT